MASGVMYTSMKYFISSSDIGGIKLLDLQGSFHRFSCLPWGYCALLPDHVTFGMS